MKKANFSYKNSITFSTSFEELRYEVEKLRNQLSILLSEHDNIKFIVCENIENTYMIHLGAIEYEIYEIECIILRIKRKIELIQAKKNRQEKIILSEIEEILDKEFVEYQKKLDEYLSKMTDALDTGGEYLSSEETKELKSLYRQIVKALHPDINPNLSDEKQKLFSVAVEAYKSGDLYRLRIIKEMIGNSDILVDDKNSVDLLQEEKDRLCSIIRNIENEIEEIKTSYPYTLIEIIKDDRKLKMKKEELNNILKEYKELAKFYKEKLKEMLRSL